MWALSKAGVVCNEYNVVKTMFYSYSESDTYSLTFLHSFLCVWDWKLSKVVYYCCSLSYYTITFRSTGVSHHVGSAIMLKEVWGEERELINSMDDSFYEKTQTRGRLHIRASNEKISSTKRISCIFSFSHFGGLHVATRRQGHQMSYVATRRQGHQMSFDLSCVPRLQLSLPIPFIPHPTRTSQRSA